MYSVFGLILRMLIAFEIIVSVEVMGTRESIAINLEQSSDTLLEETDFGETIISSLDVLTQPITPALQLTLNNKAVIPSERQKRQTCGIPSKLTTVQKESILRAHNVARVKEGSSNMAKLVWKDDLARRAQQWADQCKWEHGMRTDCDGRISGQNLYSVYGGYGNFNVDAQKVVNYWVKEKNDYNYTYRTCKLSKLCGHYTQVVWAETTEVGCGATLCESILMGNRRRRGLIVACNYRSSGNYRGEFPYKKGEACSACETNRQLKGYKCEYGLCVKCDPFADKQCTCRSQVCRNGGTWDNQRCTCVCTADFYGDLCQESCRCRDHPSVICERSGCADSKNLIAMYAYCKNTCGFCKDPPAGMCQVKESKCRPQVCENGGTWDNQKCVCVCLANFFGELCEACKPQVCNNGGTWDNQKCTCVCTANFYGELCKESCQCIDAGPSCKEFITLCQNATYREKMYTYCRKTCELCKDPPAGVCQVENNGINECENPKICGHHGSCKDTPGSYMCLCEAGYAVRDGICQDINECKQRQACDLYEICHNVDGGYNCECTKGFRKVNEQCRDINECMNPELCSGEKMRCENNPGSFRCLCDKGYTMQNGKCVDIDECRRMHYPCGYGGKCHNFDGGFNCTCSRGFEVRRGRCRDINECMNPAVCEGEKKICKNYRGSFRCLCVKGYIMQKDKCVGVDGCNYRRCGRYGKCNSFAGGYNCTCRKGLEFKYGRCKDINECKNATLCGNLRCINTVGGYKCGCFRGYIEKDGKCVGVGECNYRRCGRYGKCNSFVGGYNCTCREGFEFKYGRCRDINECKNATLCGNLRCMNTVGGYKCRCLRGYTEKDGRCVDVGECNYRRCGRYGRCNSFVGGYNCTCREGFEFKYGRCKDINECKNATLCGNLRCMNTVGGYKCRCLRGYTEKDGNCVDVDECAQKLSRCGRNGYCKNIIGRYACVCNEGFMTVRGICRDVNECRDASWCHGEHEVCVNYPGTYKCVCDNGYIREAGMCVAVPEGSCVCEDTRKYAPNCVRFTKFCHTKSSIARFLHQHCARSCKFCECSSEETPKTTTPISTPEK